MKIAPKWQVLAIVCLGIFMATLDGSILNIANPTIARDLGVDLQQIQWVVTAYMLTVTATLLFLGKLGDRIGSHRIYTAGFWDLPWAVILWHVLHPVRFDSSPGVSSCGGQYAHGHRNGHCVQQLPAGGAARPWV